MEGSIDGENKQEWREEQMGALGCANSRLRPEPRHAFKFAKFHSEKGPSKNILQRFFFLIAGCIGSLGYWQSLTTRE